MTKKGYATNIMRWHGGPAMAAKRTATGVFVEFVVLL